MILGYNERAKKPGRLPGTGTGEDRDRWFLRRPQNIHELTHYPILSGIDDG